MWFEKKETLLDIEKAAFESEQARGHLRLMKSWSRMVKDAKTPAALARAELIREMRIHSDFMVKSAELSEQFEKLNNQE